MRSRSCGAATATWRSPCAPTSSTACSRPTSPTRSGRSCSRSSDSLEPAYRIEIGGAVEESGKGNASIFVLFPLMVMVMLTLLMIQLQSFSRLILVFLTAPLGIVGASFGLNVANQPFGFVALLGLIALAGMIMRNAVILVDQIETDVSARPDPPRGDRRGDRPPCPAGGADGAGRDPRHDPAVALGLLGPDGDHHHGRLVRCDLPDACCTCRASMPCGSSKSLDEGGTGRAA